jgi:hypothetical protein
MTRPALAILPPPADAFPTCDECHEDRTVLIRTSYGCRYCRTCLFSAEKRANPQGQRRADRTLKHGGAR